MGKVMHVMFLHNHYSSLMQKVVVWWWNRGGSVNTKETTYVSVLHIGVHYIDFFNAEGSVFSCESSGTGEGV